MDSVPTFSVYDFFAGDEISRVSGQNPDWIKTCNIWSTDATVDHVADKLRQTYTCNTICHKAAIHDPTATHFWRIECRTIRRQTDYAV